MAKKNSYYKNNGKKPKTKKQQSAENLRKFAYQLGRVQAGLKGDTQVKDCYERGLGMKENKKQRKPLY